MRKKKFAEEKNAREGSIIEWCGLYSVEDISWLASDVLGRGNLEDVVYKMVVTMILFSNMKSRFSKDVGYDSKFVIS